LPSGQPEEAIADVPYIVKAWPQAHPDTESPDGHIFGTL
jgi:hypothetical protein